MKRFTFIKPLNYTLAVVLMVTLFALTSCDNNRSYVNNNQTNQSNQSNDIDNYAGPRQGAAPSNEVRYAITGIYQREDNGQISELSHAKVVKTANGLFMPDYMGNAYYPVYNNDMSTITESYIIRYSFDEDEVGYRPYNVSNFRFKCYDGLGTFYFNIIK